jgi:hypothetical protein
VVKSVILYDKRTEETINWPSMAIHRRELGLPLSTTRFLLLEAFEETDINHHQIEVLDMDHLADGW